MRAKVIARVCHQSICICESSLCAAGAWVHERARMCVRGAERGGAVCACGELGRWGGGGSRVYDEDEAEDRPPHTHAPPPDEFRTTPCHRAAIHIYSSAWRGSAAVYRLRPFPMQLDARSPSNPRWSKGHLRRCRCSAACGEGEGRRREEHLVPNGCARARACAQVRRLWGSICAHCTRMHGDGSCPVVPLRGYRTVTGAGGGSHRGLSQALPNRRRCP
jgi:hypothetical protein